MSQDVMLVITARLAETETCPFSRPVRPISPGSQEKTSLIFWHYGQDGPEGGVNPDETQGSQQPQSAASFSFTGSAGTAPNFTGSADAIEREMAAVDALDQILSDDDDL